MLIPTITVCYEDEVVGNIQSMEVEQYSLNEKKGFNIRASQVRLTIDLQEMEKSNVCSVCGRYDPIEHKYLYKNKFSILVFKDEIIDKFEHLYCFKNSFHLHVVDNISIYSNLLFKTEPYNLSSINLY